MIRMSSNHSKSYEELTELQYDLIKALLESQKEAKRHREENKKGKQEISTMSEELATNKRACTNYKNYSETLANQVVELREENREKTQELDDLNDQVNYLSNVYAKEQDVTRGLKEELVRTQDAYITMECRYLAAELALESMRTITRRNIEEEEEPSEEEPSEEEPEERIVTTIN